MSRRSSVNYVREVSDSIYGSHFLGRIINKIMKHGKKTIAEKIVYNVIELYAKKYSISSEESIRKLEEIISKVKPTVELKSKRVGGATLSIPIEVRSRRAFSLAINWIHTSFLQRNEKTASLRFFGEILDIAEGRGASLTKRENIQKMADANRVYSHHRR